MGANASTNTAGNDRTGRFQIAVLLATAVVATIAYARGISSGFQFDDIQGVVEKLALRDLGAFVHSVLLREYVTLGRPITDLTFALDFRLFGLSPAAYHLTSFGLHLATVLLAYVTARLLARRAGWPHDGLALFCAGVFALHPVQSQAVLYISQRAEVLASLLYLAAFALLLDLDERPLRGRGVVTWIVAFAAFVLAIGAKAIALTLPSAYLIACACIPGDPGTPRAHGVWRRRLLVVAPFAVFSVSAAAQQLFVLRGNTGAGFDVRGVGVAVYLFTQLRVLLAYLRLLAWPSGQNIDHEVALSSGLLEPPWTAVAGLLLAALLTVAIVLVVRARFRTDAPASAARLVGFGVLWFFLTLAPTSSFVPLADVMVEHRMYLPLFGIAIATAAGGSFVLDRIGARAIVTGAAAAAVLCALALVLYARNGVWTSSEALWADAVSKSPTKSRVHANYARELGFARKFPEAVAQYQLALRYASDGFVSRPSVLGNMGPLLIKLGRREEAFTVLRSALAGAPGDPLIETNLAVWHLEGGDLARAHELVEDAVRQRPSDGFARNIFGVVLLREGQELRALEQFRFAVSAGGRDAASASLNLATVADQLGFVQEACVAWAHYAEIAPTVAARASSRRRALGCR